MTRRLVAVVVVLLVWPSLDVELHDALQPDVEVPALLVHLVDLHIRRLLAVDVDVSHRELELFASHELRERVQDCHLRGVVVVHRRVFPKVVELDHHFVETRVVVDLVEVPAVDTHLRKLLELVHDILLLVTAHLAVAVRQLVVVADLLVLELRHVEVARPAHAPADRVALLSALVAHRARIGPALLPLLPRLLQVLGVRPKNLRNHPVAHAVAHLRQPALDELLGNRRRQLVVLLRRDQPVLLHALVPAIRHDALGTQHVAHVPTQPVQTPPRPRLRTLLQIQIDVVVDVDLHDMI